MAVLTGDLIKSRRLSDLELDKTRRALCAAAAEVNEWQPGAVLGEPDFFRGDAWQMLVTVPKPALRIAVYMRAFLLESGLSDTRIVIGLGAAEKVYPKRISLSTGQAFTLSGLGLDNLTRYTKMSIALSAHCEDLAAWLPVVAQLCDVLIGHWTTRQAKIIRLALAPSEPTHDEIAQSINPKVSKQAVTKILAGADWHVLRSVIEQFEKTDWMKLCAP
ncbi:MAG: hypothetical protein GF344_12255 [Chitinivibrionales bacterium]|nr:hypothetical protein [Chitinivibrionales bacterium]MBD3357543.1 hypothetical protein [Chitinivibrionales bacterium]